MHSVKNLRLTPFFVWFATIVITVTLSGRVAVAAEVTRVNASQGHVYVSAGKPDGFVVGAKVCINSSTEAMTCGEVFRTTDSYAVVRVDSRAARYIEYGMSATLIVKDSEEED